MPDARVRLAVKVVPGASRTEISGWLGERLKIRVSAPPERGKANAAVETLICDILGLPGGSVCVVSRGTSPLKILEISGLSESEVHEKLCKTGIQTRGPAS